MSPRSTSDETAKRLATECAAIRTLLAQALRDEVLTRHQIGIRVSKVKGDVHRYGDHAVDWLSTELGIARRTLYRYALVAENWSEFELERLSRKPMAHGEPISWSHLVALTDVAIPTTRTALAERAITDSWSVRELAEHIAAHRADPIANGSAESAEEASVRAAVVEGVQNASRTLVQTRIFVEALDERLLVGGGDEMLFDGAIGVYEALYDQVEAALRALRRAKTASSGRMRVASRSVLHEPSAGNETEEADSAEPGNRRRTRV